MISDDRDDHAAGTPDSDPDHIDPAGDIADLLEEELTGVELGEGTDPEDLRAFIDAAEAGEFGPIDPGVEAQVRIARTLLEQDEEG